MAAKSAEGACTIRLNGEMTIYTAAEQSALLLDKLEECDELELDLEDVNDIDSAGVQLLLVLERASMQMECSLRLVNHSRPLIEVLKLLELQAQLGAPTPESADEDT